VDVGWRHHDDGVLVAIYSNLKERLLRPPDSVANVPCLRVFSLSSRKSSVHCYDVSHLSKYLPNNSRSVDELDQMHPWREIGRVWPNVGDHKPSLSVLCL
jgi:hypothetical protein